MFKQFILGAAIGLTFIHADEALAIDAGGATLAAKVNTAGKQRMLVERVAKSACFTQLAAQMEHHRDLQWTAADEFLSALRTLTAGGDAPSVHREEEENEMVLNGIRQVRSSWVDFERVLTAFNASALPSHRQFIAVVEEAQRLREESDELVKLYVSTADGEQTDLARTIDIAGRQRMLIQYASKDVCLIALRVDEAESRKELGEAIDLFEKTLAQLINGDEEAGITPPRDEAHRSQYERVRLIWEVMKPFYRNAQYKPTMHHFDYLSVATWNDTLTLEMDRAVRAYFD